MGYLIFLYLFIAFALTVLPLAMMHTAKPGAAGWAFAGALLWPLIFALLGVVLLLDAAEWARRRYLRRCGKRRA